MSTTTAQQTTPTREPKPETTTSGGGAASGSSYAVQLKQSLAGLDFAAQEAMLSPVQAKGEVQASGANAVHQHAEAGTRGGGGALPHGDKIQQAFGEHDVSNVKAYTGGDAAAACDGMGAQAFATGDKIAFKGGADLHTAAHEAAHVVQQRAGVSLSGGVGKSGDAYEQHADKVADAVVAGKSAAPILEQMTGGGGGGVQKKATQLKPADPDKGISDGKVTLEDHNGGAVGSVAKGKAGLEQSKENSKTLSEQIQSIKTQAARSEKEMLAAIAAGGMPRYVARVDEISRFQGGTFGNPGREFVFATEPADLRGCKPGAALIKVGWTKAWLGGKIGKSIAVCILDTTKAVPTAGGPDKKMAVGKMEWPEIIAKAMGDSKFKREAFAAGVKDEAELQTVFDIVKATPVKASPRSSDPALADKAGKVRKLLDTNYGANELYTGMGATMNTEGGLGAREVMVMNNGTGLKLTPDNHAIESLGTLTQGEFDSLPD